MTSLRFLVTPVRLASVEHSGTCPPGDQCFIVRNFSLTLNEVNHIWDYALTVTRREGGNCVRKTAQTWTDELLEFHLAHSLEHLAAIDLLTRGILDRYRFMPPYSAARTIHGTVNDEPNTSIFYFRRGLVSDVAEERKSVNNAIAIVNERFSHTMSLISGATR